MLDPVYVDAEVEALKLAVEGGLMDDDAKDPEDASEVVIPDGDSE